MGIRLPLEYQEVEYLESTGIQYIYTGIDLNNSGYRSETIISWSAIGQRQLIGAEQVGYWGINSNGYYEIYNVSQYQAEIGRWDNVIFEVTYSENKSKRNLTVNGENIFVEVESTTKPSGAIYVFIIQYNASGTVKYGASAKIKSQRIFINEELVRNFVPCYRKSDSEPGMYDLVSNTFFTNSGTGEFFVGPNVGNYINPRLVDRRRILIAKLTSLFRYIASSETGFVTFDTNIEKPIEVICEFSPQQDLHRMLNPYLAGASVNLIPDGTDTSNGYVSGKYLNADGTTTTNANNYVSEYFEVDPSVTYTWSNRVNSSTSASLCFYNENKEYISGIAINKQYSHTFTPPEGAVYARSTQTTYTFQGNNPTSAAYQLEVGSTATEYRRYSNICLISGRIGANIEQRQKNLVEPDNPENPMQNYTHTSTGTVLYSSEYNAFYCSGLGIAEDKRGGAYQTLFVAPDDMVVTFSIDTYNVGTNYGIRFYAKGSRVTDIHGTTNTWYHYSYTVTLSKGQKLQAAYYDKIYWKNLQVVVGTSADQYYPYIANTAPITFTDPSTGDPMTIYGGTLTLNEDGSADLVNKYCLYSITSSTSKRSYSENSSKGTMVARYTLPVGDTAESVLTNDMIFSNAFTSSENNNQPTYDAWTCFVYHSTIATFAVPKEDYPTSADFDNLLDSIGTLQLSYPLATPQTYHFSNLEQLESFIGQNNVWTDLNCPITVKYYKKQQ